MTPHIPRLLSAAIVAFAVVLAAPAWSIGTVSDGGVTFGYNVDFNTSSGNTVNADFTGASPGDQLYESWWFFRVNGETQETALGTPDAEDYSLYGGTTGRLTWNDPGGSGDFSAFLDFNVIETAPGEGVVFQNLVIVNTGATDLDIDIFHYTDLDLSGTWRRDSAALQANPDGIEMLISDGATGATAPFIGYDADAYQVTTWRALLNDLTDTSVTNLDNSGLPFNGTGTADFTGGFQWTQTVAPGTYERFLVQFGSDAALQDPLISTVPEPTPLVLAFLGLAGLASYGREKR